MQQSQDDRKTAAICESKGLSRIHGGGALLLMTMVGEHLPRKRR